MRRLATVNYSLYRALKLERKRVRRTLRQRRSDELARISAAKFDAAFGQASLIIRKMGDATVAAPFQHKGKVKFNLPESFSIIDSPEQTIAALAELSKSAHSQRLGSVYIDYEKVQQYDLGANALLDVIVDELSIEARRTRRVLHWRGKYPKNPAHIRFIRALGVIKKLKIQHEYPTQEDAEKLEMFDSRCRHYIRELRPKQADLKGRVTAKFADHIDRCLGRINKALTPEARSNLCTYVGEVIDNAEQHSGMLDWAIQGYLDTTSPELVCEIVIFNFGKSIADTFALLPAGSFTHGQVNRYVQLHSQKKLFQHEWRKEDLYTLIALQGHVSSKNTGPHDTRGNGTIDLIDLFQKVSDECTNGDAEAKMIIVSGSSAVLFDGKYKMKANDDGVKIIAFNAENDLTQRPDKTYVRTLRGVEFPGTLISLRFPLSTARSTVSVESPQP